MRNARVGLGLPLQCKRQNWPRHGGVSPRSSHYAKGGCPKSHHPRAGVVHVAAPVATQPETLARAEKGARQNLPQKLPQYFSNQN